MASHAQSSTAARDEAMSELSEPAAKLLAAVTKRPRDVYYGRSGWVPCSLPKGVKREHFDELMRSGRVTVSGGILRAAP